ncbi:MAG: ATPase P [Actinomycetota bacterium]|nr:ATPase P [Actinomycetota bacterium]
MIKLTIPGRKAIEVENLILDMNGTIAMDGMVSKEIVERVKKLAKSLKIYVLTAGTQGRIDEIKEILQVEVHQINRRREAEQKAEFLRKVDPERTITIGNGTNDSLMLKQAALGIGIIGEEGISREALLSADVIVKDPKDALDLLLKPKRLQATLRK